MSSPSRVTLFPPSWFDQQAWDAGKPPESDADHLQRMMDEADMVRPIAQRITPLCARGLNFDHPSWELWSWAVQWIAVDDHFQQRFFTKQDQGHEEFLMAINPHGDFDRIADCFDAFLVSFDTDGRTRGWIAHMRAEVLEAMYACSVPRSPAREGPMDL